MKLPIEQALPELRQSLQTGRAAVLVAQPGAGKTTRVPLALLDEPWMKGGRIFMLEPRRLAARAAARYMASLLREPVGETVGYRVRMDSKVGPRTRIEVITEGILTRMLQEDPALEGVSLVIFDELHERSLHADLGLALCLQSQALLREDLRILAMSATMDAAAVSRMMGDAPIIHSEGRMFPVETRYVGRGREERLEKAIVRVIHQALNESGGDILVFLPGAGEIRRVEALLRASEAMLRHTLRIAPLYSQLSAEAQDIAIAPSVQGERKVVLSTSIAETSLTVEGIHIVIDSGLMRIPRFSPRTGMTRLETVTVSRASADQRRGRAGRLGPGVCYRLWTEAEDRYLAEHGTPEILDADLTAFALELAIWGVSDPAELAWIDQPPVGALSHGRELLQQLGALRSDGAVTEHGRSMSRLGLHPRLAHMLLEAKQLGWGSLACELAAVLSERDIMPRGRAQTDVDISNRIELLRGKESHRADPALLQRIRAEANQWKRSLGIPLHEQAPLDRIGVVLSFAYPDRIGQHRGDGRYLLRNGRGAAIPYAGAQAVWKSDYIVAANLEDQGPDSRIELAAPVDLSDILGQNRDQLEEDTRVEWDRSAQAVRARKLLRLGALVLKDEPITKPEHELITSALLGAIVEDGLELLPWTRAARQLQERIRFMHSQYPDDWPDATDEGLIASLEEWLAPHIHGIKSVHELKKLSLPMVLEGILTWEQRRQLEELAPTHLQVPSGSRIPIDYSDPETPVLAVRLQEMFGLKETPRIGGGRTPVTLHLLSPAQRPVQVTRDLASFWRDAYFEVKKDLKGRYPKHYWPEDPLAAPPTNRAKPRS
jgi:ATP-dependent helicase HrpB